jgi:hypothetical protein
MEAGPAFNADACRANVAHLGPARFRREIRDFLKNQFPDLFSDFEWPEGVFQGHHALNEPHDAA